MGRIDGYAPIRDYALVGDGRTALWTLLAHAVYGAIVGGFAAGF